MRVFQYDAEIGAQFPNFAGGIIIGRGIQNGTSSAELLAEYAAEQAARRAQLPESLGDIPALAGWRTAFRRFGVEPTKYRSAPESLIRRLAKKGDIPSINALVDAGNLVSIRYALPIAVIDRRAVQGTITVHFAGGSEQFTNLGTEASDPIPVGEVIFTDETGMVVARRWCWRQSAESAAVADTTDVLVTIEAQHERGHEDVARAVADLIELFTRHVGGQYTSAILDAKRLCLDG